VRFNGHDQPEPVTKRRDHRTSGQTLAEFALVIPIVIVILMGLFDLGRAVFAYTSITNAAREGARLAIVNQDEAKIEERVFGQAAAAEQDPTKLEIFFSDAGSAPDADDCTPLSIGCNATVHYSSDFRAITPIIGNLIGTLTLNAESSVPIEYVCPNSQIPSSDDCPKQP
jgi:Flp pilus assembly protein TadG